jgi:lysozyme
MPRSATAETLSHVKRWEGFRAKAYPDPGSKNGLPVTIGYGQTRRNGRPIKLGETITEAEATEWLVNELARVSTVIERLVAVPLTDNQHGALLSFVYNVGDGAFAKSTLLKKLNAGDYAAVPAQLARWNKNDGKVMEGLTNRRAAEAGLWARGSHVASNTVMAKPGNPVKELVTPENIGAAGGLLGGAAAIASGNGPVQYAIAALMVVAALTIAFIVIRKATR